MTTETESNEPTETTVKPQQPTPRTNAGKAAAKSSKGKSTAASKADAEPACVDLTKPADHEDEDHPPVIMRLHSSDKFPPNGQPFGVNGRFFALKADVWYRVPGFLPLSISDVVEDMPIKDENDRFVGTRAAKRFPYEIFKA